MTRGVLPSGWLGRWDGAARVEIYFVTIGGSDAGRKTIYGGKFTVSPQFTLQNPADVWERGDGHPICGELDTSNKCDRVFPSNPPPLARGEVCHRAPPKTDKHGIHQGSGKHVTSSTLLLCHTMSGSVISCLKVW